MGEHARRRPARRSLDSALGVNPAPLQREVWFAELDPVLGTEQAGRRPVVVLSREAFNRARRELAVIVPLTSTDTGIRLHLAIDPPEGGLRGRSFAMPDMIRSVSHERLLERWGIIRPETLDELVRRVRVIIRPE